MDPCHLATNEMGQEKEVSFKNYKRLSSSRGAKENGLVSGVNVVFWAAAPIGDEVL